MLNLLFLQYFCKLYNEKEKLPEIDFEFEFQQKVIEIEKINQQIFEIQSQTISEKPIDFESDIFKACKILIV